MAQKPEKISKTAAQSLQVGHFHTKPGYRTVRESGRADWLIILTAAGRGEIRGSDGTGVDVGPGDCILYSPGAYQHYAIARDQGEWEIFWAHFLPPLRWEPFLAWPACGAGCGLSRIEDRFRRDAVVEACRRMCRADPLDAGIASLFRQNALEEVILWCESVRATNRRRLDPRIAAAVNYCARNLFSKIAIEDLARAASLSPSRFAHLFTAQMGCTPMRHVMRLRLREAARRLEFSTFSIKEIASQVGFATPFHLSRRFRDLFDCCPKEFRRQRRVP